jgi:hypothetical protein
MSVEITARGHNGGGGGCIDSDSDDSLLQGRFDPTPNVTC